MALSSSIREALWLRTLMSELTTSASPCIQIFSDNQAAIALLKNSQSSSRSKHIDIAHHFAREHVQNKHVTIEYISTADMVADTFTKPLPRSKFETCCTSLGLSTLAPP